MNEIRFYVRRINEGKAIPVDQYNYQKVRCPSCVRGQAFAFDVSVFEKEEDSAPVESFPDIAFWNAFAFGEWTDGALPYLQASGCTEEDGVIHIPFPETNTTTIASVIRGLPALECWLQIDGYAFGSPTPTLTLQCRICVENIGDPAEEPLPPASNYYTRAQIDALLAGKAGLQEFESHVRNRKMHLPLEGEEKDKILSVDEDGNPVWIDYQGGGGTQSDWDEENPESPAYIKNKPDVVTHDEVGVADGVAGLNANGKVPSAQLPLATTTALGAVTVNAVTGIGRLNNASYNNTLYIIGAATNEIDSKAQTYKPIVPLRLDYAVRSVLPNVTIIPATATSYSLLDASATTNNHSWQYTHTPDAASTYMFPAVTDTAVAHRIKLTIDFTNVQTYSFVDANGDAIVPLFTPSISAGDMYEFRCEYSTAQSRWLIYPCKQGAVADDFVMRGEVGAANGVAGLDANAKVPRIQLPTIGANADAKGVAYAPPGDGVSVYNGMLYLTAPTATGIANRVSRGANKGFGAISTNNINAAVTAALTDAHRIGVDDPLTDAQKANACDSLGAALRPVIQSGAPTTATVGAVGQLYVDTAMSKTYHCTAVTTDDTDPQNPVTTYTWDCDITEHNPRAIRFLIGTDNNLPANYSLNIGYNNSMTYYTLAVGAGLVNTAPYGAGNIVFGKYNISYNTQSYILVAGNGTSASNRSNALMLSSSGDLYIAGGHQQGVTTIPSNNDTTTPWILTEGVHQHTPDVATTYQLPAIVLMIVADNKYFTRDTTTDGMGYYGWISGNINRYTASATPAVGDNTYTNTSLTAGAKAVTDIDNRTREIILNVRFSATALSADFEDSEGNAITALDVPETIHADDVIRYSCTYETVISKWVIIAKLLTPSSTPPGPEYLYTVSNCNTASYNGDYYDSGETYNGYSTFTNGTGYLFFENSVWALGEKSGGSYVVSGLYGPGGSSPIGEYTTPMPGENQATVTAYSGTPAPPPTPGPSSVVVSNAGASGVNGTYTLDTSWPSQYGDVYSKGNFVIYYSSGLGQGRWIIYDATTGTLEDIVSFLLYQNNSTGISAGPAGSYTGVSATGTATVSE